MHTKTKTIIFIFLFIFINSIAFCDITQSLWNKKYLGSIHTIKISDLNNDGKKEIVVGSESGITVLDESGNILWQNNKIISVYKIELSDIDNDGNKEILASSYLEFFISDYDGSNSFIMNATDFSVRPVPFTIADTDNNGIKEIYFGYDNIYEYEYINKTMQYKKIYILPELESGMKNDVSLITSGDINGDNIPEIVVNLADGLYFIINNTFQKFNSDITDNLTIKNIILFDTNNDGKKEIIVYGTYEKDFYVLDYNGNLLWKFSGDNYIRQLYFIDINNDGIDELLVNANNSTYVNEATNNIIYALNLKGELLWETNFPESFSGTLTSLLKISNDKICYIIGKTFGFLDSNNGNIVLSQTFQNDLNNIQLLNSQYLIISGINIYKYDLFTNLSTILYENGYIVSKIVTGDINGDGIDEIAVLDSLLYPQILHVYNYKGELLWQKFISPSDVKINDLNGDGINEIIVVGNGVTVYDSLGNVIWNDLDIKFPKKIEVADINNDGKKEIVVARWGGITIYDRNGEVILTIDISLGGSVSSLKLYDINNDGYKEILFVSSFIYEYDKDGNLLAQNGGWNDYDTLRIALINNNIRIISAQDNEIDLYDSSLNKLSSYSNDNTIRDIIIKNNNIYFADGKKVVKLSCNNDSLTKVWEYQHEQFYSGFTLPMPSKLTVYNDYIVAAGYRIYIIDDNGNLVYLLDPLNSGLVFNGGTFPGLTVANFYQDKQTLLFGLDGIYAYGEEGTLPESPEYEILSINPGWNLKSLPTDTTVLSSFFQNINSLWIWKNNKWNIYSSDKNIQEIIAKYNIPVIEELTSGEGFWIYAENYISFKFLKTNNYGFEKFINNLSNGWNLVGVGEDLILENNIDVLKNITTLWTWRNSKWEIWAPDENLLELLEKYGINKANEVYKGEGFWIDN